jgi:hypothetical protein
MRQQEMFQTFGSVAADYLKMYHGILCFLLVSMTAALLPVRLAHAYAQTGVGLVQTARVAAPIDLTGYWVSITSTIEWRYLMMTPPKGDFGSIPLNAAGQNLANAWDPRRDEATGNQCKAYGAPGVMRIPGRLSITWENDNTLKIETSAGTQTRQLHFAPTPVGEPTWQGHSLAQWLPSGGQRGIPASGSLQVVTTRMRPGYIHKNGVPYGTNAVFREYIYRISEPDAEYLVVTTILEDPDYLQQAYVRNIHFKREPDGAKWSPTPCTVD